MEISKMSKIKKESVGRLLSGKRFSIIQLFTILFVCPFVLLSQTVDTNVEDLIQQYVQSRGTGIITFDTSNIKQFWIDNSVIGEKEHFTVLLNQTNQSAHQSIPLKIQLANVNEWQDCTIEVLTESPDVEFTVLNSQNKILSSSSKQDNFINYTSLASTFHIEDTPDSAFLLKFSSSKSSEAKIKKVILSFSKNAKSRYLYPPGKLVITKDNIKVSSSGKLIPNDSGSFSLTGKNVNATSSNFICSFDNTLSSSVKIKNNGNAPVRITLSFASYNKKHERLDIRSYPYANNNQILKVIHSESNSTSIVVDSYPDKWAKSLYLAMDAKEDMSDIPNTNILEGRIVDIKKLENNQAEIQLNKTVGQAIPEGTALRLHGKGITNVNIETKTIQPGKEEILSGSFQKDDAFFEKYSFGEYLFYCKPLLTTESLDANEDINILVSDFIINY